MLYERGTIPAEALEDYLAEMGAATIKEIKLAFHTDSRSARISLYKLGCKKGVNLIVMGGSGYSTYWILWPEGQRGTPNIRKLRAEAQGESVPDTKPEKKAKKAKTTKVQVDFSEDD